MRKHIILSVIGIQNLILKLLKKAVFKKSDIKSRICINRSANIGDAVCTVPVIYEIRKRYPQAHITVLTTPVLRNLTGLQAILFNQDWIDDVIVYYEDEVHRPREIMEFSQKMKKCNFDYFINLPYEKAGLANQLKMMYLAHCLGVRQADGFYVSTTKILKKYQNKHFNFPNEVNRLLNGLPFAVNEGHEYPLKFSDKDIGNVESILKQYNLLNKEDKTIIISFSCKADAKRWDKNNFKIIARKWTERGGSVLLIGSGNDYSLANDIRDGNHNIINVCGKLSVIQSMILIKKIGKILAVDTGTIHLAAAVGAKSITLFSSYYFKGKWEADNKKNIIIRKDVPCAPCLQNTCKWGNNRCMNLITPEEVWKCMCEAWEV